MTRVHICPIHRRAGQRLKQGRASLDKSRPPFPDPTEDHTKRIRDVAKKNGKMWEL